MAFLDVLGEPLRLGIVRHLSDHELASLGELAAATGVHPNTLRQHVLLLERAGVLEREAATAAGRGRPAVHYRLAADAVPGRDFLALAQILAHAASRSGERELQGAARRWARSRPPGRHPAPAATAAKATLEQLGFRVRVNQARLELSACPCPLVAPEHPQLVCDASVAAVDETLGGRTVDQRVVDRAHDPRTRTCTLTLVTGGSRVL